MPSSNHVTTKCCIWQNYNCYIMIKYLPNKVKCMNQIFKLKKIFFFVLKAEHVPFLWSWSIMHGTCTMCWWPLL